MQSDSTGCNDDLMLVNENDDFRLSIGRSGVLVACWCNAVGAFLFGLMTGSLVVWQWYIPHLRAFLGDRFHSFRNDEFLATTVSYGPYTTSKMAKKHRLNPPWRIKSSVIIANSRMPNSFRRNRKNSSILSRKRSPNLRHLRRNS
jgi:hypothetical protein